MASFATGVIITPAVGILPPRVGSRGGAGWGSEVAIGTDVAGGPKACPWGKFGVWSTLMGAIDCLSNPSTSAFCPSALSDSGLCTSPGSLSATCLSATWLSAFSISAFSPFSVVGTSAIPISASPPSASAPILISTPFKEPNPLIAGGHETLPPVTPSSDTDG